MRDLVGNNIYLQPVPNQHVLLTGKSGMGKTYAIVRMLENHVKNKKTALILDFSGSFTEKELEKEQFSQKNETQQMRLGEETLFLPILEFVDKSKRPVFLADILAESIAVKGYMQKKILLKICKKMLKEDRCTFCDFEEAAIAVFSDYEENGDKNGMQIVEKLLDKFSPFLTDVDIIFVSKETESQKKAEVHIIEMDLLPDETKKLVTNLLIAVYWQSIKRGKKKYDMLILDEMQYLSLKENTSLSAILREGRKFESCAVLSTQYFDDKVAVLLGQAAHWFIFRPTDKEVKKIAQQLGDETYRDLVPVLKNLRVGEALYNGTFTYNKNKRLCNEKIIVRF